MLRGISTAVCGIIILILGNSLEEGEVTRDEIRSKNAASQVAVTTVKARAEVSIQFNPSHSQQPKGFKGKARTDKYFVEYVRSGNKERQKELTGSALGVRDIIRDFDAKKGSLFIPKTSDKSPDSAILHNDQALPVLAQIWEMSLFELPRCKLPLYRLLDESQVQTIKNVTHEGRALVYLDIRDVKDRRYEVWVDPSANYLVRRLILHETLPRAKIRREREVLSFMEAKPGIYFPERVHDTLYSNGDWFEKNETVLTDVRINESLPAGFFYHQFPAGTNVADNEKGIAYIIKSDGQPGKMASFRPSPPSEVIETSTPSTADEAWPWHRFVLIGSSLAVIVGLVAILWKWRKGQVAA